jgi:hypothetical protein
MDENVGFSFLTAFKSLCLLGFFIAIVWIPLLIRQLSGFRATRTFRLVTYSLIVGSLLSEAWILFDEARFKRETTASLVSYSRARAWPYRATALVYIPHRGIHATD